MRNVVAIILVIATALFSADNVNQITPKEIAEGWLLLYDGESAFGWTPEGGAQWSTGPDGDLSAKTGESGDMVLNAVFGDYQFTCEVKSPSAKGSGPVVSGIALPQVKPNDKWHIYSVTVSGGRLTASLNGKKVLEQSVTEPGTIALHYRVGDVVSFRQVKLRPMGLTQLFNGRDLGGWRVVPKEAEWSIKDGLLHVEHGPGQVETETVYKDFVLQLEARANSSNPRTHPDGGVFVRGGYESQIHNEFNNNDRTQPANFGTGAINRLQPARKVIPNDNEFFAKTILVRGRRFAVWVNGIQVTDWDDTDDQAKLAAAAIALQANDRTANLDFRNIRAAELK